MEIEEAWRSSQGGFKKPFSKQITIGAIKIHFPTVVGQVHLEVLKP